MPDMATSSKRASEELHFRRFKDANGYEIIEHRGPDGKPAMAYVNKPGLDFNDVSRGVVGAVPYVASGGALGSMGKGAGWFVNSVLQGLALARRTLPRKADDRRPAAINPSTRQAAWHHVGGRICRAYRKRICRRSVARFVTIPRSDRRIRQN